MGKVRYEISPLESYILGKIMKSNVKPRRMGYGEERSADRTSTKRFGVFLVRKP